jgi:hypothetical protein
MDRGLWAKRPNCGSFDSLSRDHAAIVKNRFVDITTTFQPPLSGSRNVGFQSYLYGVKVNFQLPLSGSQIEKTKEELREEITFNSLSRDHRARFRDFPALRGFLPRHLFAQMNLKTTI